MTDILLEYWTRLIISLIKSTLRRHEEARASLPRTNRMKGH